MIEIIPEIVEVQGQKKIKITLKNEGKVIDADIVNPFQATQRKKTAERMARVAGAPEVRDQIESAMLAMADQLGDTPEEAQAVEEIVEDEAGFLVRPELIVAPGVVGATIPETVRRGEEIEGRWRVYLCNGGRREMRELSSRMRLHFGRERSAAGIGRDGGLRRGERQ